jgi:pyruvate dehydrogenase E2 component (dihydrolipoamide acetyltransferase)
VTEQTFRLPDLGEGLTDAEIVRWLVQVGDVVAVDQVVVEVETAKSLVDVPTPYAGRVAVLHGEAGTSVDVGTPLITVAAAEAAPAPPSTAPPQAAGSSPAAPSAAAPVEAEAYREEERAGSGNVLIGYGTPGDSGTGGRRQRRPRAGTRPAAPATAPAAVPPASPAAVPAVTAPTAVLARPVPGVRRGVPVVISPLVRKLARDRGVDLHRLAESHGGGVITRAAVEAAHLAPPRPAPSAVQPGPPPGEAERRVPLNGFRRAVSAALSRSRAEIPEATVWVDVDATELVRLRESGRTPAGPGPGLLAYLARFVVAGLRQYPVLNARVDTDRQEIVELAQINLGLAVQSERGLVVPAVLDAGSMTTERLDAEIRRVTAGARAGRATHEELTSGTFTLNNYGSFRVDGSAAIINHPQVAILGFGRILDRPWVVDGEICIRKITQMSFAFDHRVCDGGTAAGFMRTVADAVEDPASIIAKL